MRGYVTLYDTSMTECLDKKVLPSDESFVVCPAKTEPRKKSTHYHRLRLTIQPGQPQVSVPVHSCNSCHVFNSLYHASADSKRLGLRPAAMAVAVANNEDLATMMQESASQLQLRPQGISLVNRMQS